MLPDQRSLISSMVATFGGGQWRGSKGFAVWEKGSQLFSEAYFHRGKDRGPLFQFIHETSELLRVPAALYHHDRCLCHLTVLLTSALTQLSHYQVHIRTRHAEESPLCCAASLLLNCSSNY